MKKTTGRIFGILMVLTLLLSSIPVMVAADTAETVVWNFDGGSTSGVWRKWR